MEEIKPKGKAGTAVKSKLLDEVGALRERARKEREEKLQHERQAEI